MAKGLIKYLGIIAGVILALIGLFQVPVAVMSGDMGALVNYTIILFVGILLLGWAFKD